MKLRLTPRKAAKAATQTAALREKQRRRGSQEGLKPFAKGFDPRRNPGGKPKVHQKFSQRIAEEMAQPAPVKLAQALGCKRGATKFDVMITAAIHNAMQGDLASFTALRDITEGKLPTTNFTLPKEMEAYVGDPQFRQFLTDKHREYTEAQLGHTAGTIEGLIPAIPAPGADESGSED